MAEREQGRNTRRAAPLPSGRRDAFIDFVRAFSLLVVIAWHWVFTIIIWKDDGPHANEPHRLHVRDVDAHVAVPGDAVVFFVGGYANLQSYQSGRRRGRKRWAFVGSRVKQLAIPSLALIAVWGGIALVVASFWHAEWIDNAALLIVSPLWFIATYLLLLLLFRSCCAGTRGSVRS